MENLNGRKVEFNWFGTVISGVITSHSEDGVFVICHSESGSDYALLLSECEFVD